MAGAASEGVAVGGHRVVVLGGIGDDEHGRVRRAALHLFASKATLRTATPVVSPVSHGQERTNEAIVSSSRAPLKPQVERERERVGLPRIWRAFDGFLAVLTPRPYIGGEPVGGDVAHHLLLLILPGITEPISDFWIKGSSSSLKDKQEMDDDRWVQR